MAQYTEGQKLKGSDGNVYVVTNGTPVLAPQSVSSANPAKPLELRQKMVQVQQDQANLKKSPYELRKEAADAGSAELKLKTEKEAYAAAHVAESPALVGLTGDALMAKLPADERPMIQGMIDGRLAPPTASALKDPTWQQRLKWASQVDPTFDESQWSARVKGRAAIVNGTLGKSQNALTTAMAHAGSLMDLIPQVASHGPALGFLPTSHAVNAVENSYARQQGEPGISQWDYNANQLANELEAAYTGGQGSEQGRERQLASLNPNMSADQKKAVIHKALDLLASKVAANYAQYSWAFKGGKPTWDMLDPDALAALKKYAPDVLAAHFAAPSATPSSQQSAIPPAAPPPPGTPPPPPFSPPPTGPTNGDLKPSTDGFNSTPDPQSAQFWADAARQGTPYRTALNQWQGDVKARGLVGITPPPPDAYHKAASYIRDHPNVPYQPFSSVTRTPTDLHQQIVAPATGAVFSGPGVAAGHAINSAAANIPTALAGDQGASYNAVSDAMHPNYALAGDVAGTVAGVAGTSKLLDAGVTAGKNLPFLGQYLRAIGVVAPEGADSTAVTSAGLRRGLTADNIYGATSGAAQNTDNPAGGAAEGMLAMTGGNVAGRYVLGPAMRAAAETTPVQRMISALRGSQFKPPAALDAGQNLIYSRTNPTMGAIRGKLSDASDLGLPYALADADPRLQALTGSAVRKSPDALALANQNLVPRQLGQGERAIAQINSHLAPVGDVPTIKADATARAQAAASPLYEQAYAKPGRTSDVMENLLATPAGRQALGRARVIAANEGRDPNAMGFGLDDQGETIFTSVPSAQTLDYVKRGLDDVLEPYRNQFTGKLQLDEAGRAINGVRQKFLTEADRLFPEYGAARKAYGDIASQGTAAQNGADATSVRVTPEQTQTMLTNSGANAPFFQRGYASDMADQIERQRLSGNPYNLVNGSMGQQAKVNMIFPNAGRFAQAQSLEGDMARTTQEALGGSQTQPRAEADKMFSGSGLAGTAMDLGLSAATGIPPIGLMRRGAASLLSDALKLGVGRSAKSKADAIAPILLNTDPNAAGRMLDELQRQAMMRQLYRNQTNLIGAGIAAPTIYGATQQ